RRDVEDERALGETLEAGRTAETESDRAVVEELRRARVGETRVVDGHERRGLPGDEGDLVLAFLDHVARGLEPDREPRAAGAQLAHLADPERPGLGVGDAEPARLAPAGELLDVLAEQHGALEREARSALGETHDLEGVDAIRRMVEKVAVATAGVVDG